MTRSDLRLLGQAVTLAADVRMDAVCIGNEFEKTTGRVREWRAIIRDVRRAYPGRLTYGAGGDEAFRIRFWDALDFIGISAYYPLVDRAEPSRADLVAAWGPLAKSLGDLFARWRKPVVFTELGYRSVDFAAWRQWEIRRDAPVNLQTQSDAYAAFFEAVWPQPWFGGVYWWKWFSFPDDGGAADNDYTPRNKPAELVLQRYFGGNR